MHRYLRHLGWTDWDQMIGIRADEQRRVAKIRARGHSTESIHEPMCMPLADAGVTVRDVGALWQAQALDLHLLTVNGRTLEGRSEEHTSERVSHMRIAYAVFCLKIKKQSI